MTILPNAAPVSEWPVTLDGIIAACVQAASGVIDHMYTGVANTSGWLQQTAQSWQQHGMAGPGGASNWASASQFLSQQGIPNTAYGPGWFASNNFVPTVNNALAQGKPVLFGLSQAYNLRDSVTGAMPDIGVRGHAIDLVGWDARGNYIAVDPNTPGTGYNYYSPADLFASGASSAVIPNLPPMGGPGTGFPQNLVNQESAAVANQASASVGPPAADPWTAALQGLAGLPGAVNAAAGNVISTIQADLLKAGLFLLAVIFLVFGLYLLFKPQVDSAAQSAGQAALVAAEAGA